MKMKFTILLVFNLLMNCSDQSTDLRNATDLQNLSIVTFNKQMASPGEIITVEGIPYSPGMVIQIEDTSIPIKLTGSNSFTFPIPNIAENGPQKVFVSLENQKLLIGQIIITTEKATDVTTTDEEKATDVTTFDIDPSLLCKDVSYVNSERVKIQGTRDCTIKECEADGEIGCITTEAFKAAKIEGIEEKIIAGKMIAGSEGKVSLQTYSDCTEDGSTGCIATSNYPVALIDGIENKILSGMKVAGVSGNVVLPDPKDVENNTSYGIGGSSLTGNLIIPKQSSVIINTQYGAEGSEYTGSATFESYLPCAHDGAIGCLTTESFPAADVTDIPEVVLSGHKVAGVAGTAPSYPHCNSENLVGCITTETYQSMNLSSAGSHIGLTSQNFFSSITTDAPVEFWDQLGTRHTINGDSHLHPGNLKKDVQIFGVKGEFPSTEFPLPGATDDIDLESQTFNDLIKLDSSFEYWNSAGVYQSSTGDSDLGVTSKIRSGEVIFDTAGSFTSYPNDPSLTNITIPDASSVNLAWNDVGVHGYLLIRNKNSAVDFIPKEGQNYTTGPQAGNEIVYVGKDLSFTDTALTTHTTYYYSLYTFNNNLLYSQNSSSGGVSPSYPSEPTLIVNPFSGNTVHASYSDTNDGNWATTAGYLVIRKADSPVDFLPSEGVNYPLGTQSGNEIIYSGTDLEFLDTGLTSGTTYHYAVFTYTSDLLYSLSPGRHQATPVSGSGYYRWRLFVDSVQSSSYVEIWEMKLKMNGVFRSGSEVTCATCGNIGGVPISNIVPSSEWSTSWQGYGVFEGNIGSGSNQSWASTAGAFSSTSPYDGAAWLEVQFASPIMIEGIQFYPEAGKDCADSYYFQYHDGIDWITVPGSNQTNTACGEWVTVEW